MVPAPPYYPQLRTATEGGPDRSDGSRTITITPGRDSDDEGQHDDDRGEGHSSFQGVLRLRGGPGPRGQGPRVQWEDGTVDNEFMNRKKSKICCIFHKNKPKNFEDPFAESSSSSESDSGDDSSTSGGEEPQDEQDGTEESKENGSTKGAHSPAPSTATSKKKRSHVHGEHCSHKGRQPPANAYETQPKYGKFKKDKARSKGSSTMTVNENA